MIHSAPAPPSPPYLEAQGQGRLSALSESWMPSRSTLLRGAGWNVVGLGAPLLVALVAIPPTVAGLGLERFGALALAWTVLGYFGVFDLGLGRAATQVMARRDAGGAGGLGRVLGTAFVLSLLLGAVGGLALALPAPLLVTRLLPVPEALRDETVGALRWLGLALPLVVSTALLRGVLEARQRFGLVNAVRVPLGVFTYGAPLLVLPFTRSLAVVVAVLAAGRAAGWAAHLVLALRAVPELRRGLGFESAQVRPLLALGGWMTVSNVVGPVMVHLDRLLIGARVSLSAVAFYATPWELVTKLLIVPSAVAQVLFPALAGALAADPGRARRLFAEGLRGLALVLFPPTLVLVALAPELLHAWLGPSFAAQSTTVMRVLAVGVFLNGLAQVPFALVQGAGRADLTARLHLLELPLYLALLLLLLRWGGLAGAALAWTLRAGIDAAALAVLAQRLSGPTAPRMGVEWVLGALAVFALASLPAATGPRVAVLAAALALYGGMGWRRLLTLARP
jgi:O-antigen/teichoic acid export membrane protein